MKKMLLLFFSVIILSSCESDNTFSLEFINGSSDTYKLYINDVYQTDVLGKKKVTYSIPAGYWSAKVIQKTGYILIPTTLDFSGTSIAGESYYVVFP